MYKIIQKFPYNHGKYILTDRVATKVIDSIINTLNNELDSEVEVVFNEFKYRDNRSAYTTHIFNTNTGKLEYVSIHIRTNILRSMNLMQLSEVRERYSGYLRGQRAPHNELTLFVLTFLHELGHVHFVEKFIEHSNIDSLIKMRDESPNLIRRILSKGLLSKHKFVIEHLSYTWSVEESRSEIFALTNFPHVWENIKKDISKW